METVNLELREDWVLESFEECKVKPRLPASLAQNLPTTTPRRPLEVREQ